MVQPDYLLRFADYSPFRQAITLKVVEDLGLPLNTTLKTALKTGTDFRAIPDEAIKCAVRHLFIATNTGPKTPPSNPAQVTRSWLNLLRWELMTFWRCDAGSNIIDDDTGTSKFSSEHPRRSGELLAEGFAILLLERRLKVNRNRFFFFSGSDARPDFVVSGKLRPGTGFVSPTKHKFGLECRARAGIDSIHASDYQALANKKGMLLHKEIRYDGKWSSRLYWPTSTGSGLDFVLASYLSYGPKQACLIVGDPGEPGEPMADVAILEIVLSHYAQQCTRIGLRGHHRIAMSALDQLKKGPMPTRRADPGNGEDGALNKVRHAGREFLGRFFSETVRRVGTGELTRDAAERLLEEDLVDYFFLGLDTEVLRMIRSYSWEELLNYFVEPPDDTKMEPLADFVHSDGLLMKTQLEETEDREVIRLAIVNSVRQRS